MSIFDKLARLIGARSDEAEQASDETVRYVELSSIAASAPAQPGPTAMRRAESEGFQFPAFRATASDITGDAFGDAGQDETRLALAEAFTPAQPVTDRSKFAGRLEVLARLISLLEDQRVHVVIYGERGIGKTSLVHILSDVARESGYLVVYASCGAKARFDELFHTVLAQIPARFLDNSQPMSELTGLGETIGEQMPTSLVDPRRMGEICARIAGTRVIVILDEYDRLHDADVRQGVAELIKNLSDRAARVQLVIAGVASNLQELIGYIPSIRRNVVGLPVPKLTTKELTAMVKIGEAAAGVKFDRRCIQTIDLLCNGSPYLARLLCHHASMSALDQRRMTIRLKDIFAALDQIVEEAESRLGPRTQGVLAQVFSEGDYSVLAAIARGSGTPDGWFSVEDVRPYLDDPKRADPAKELERLHGIGHLLDRRDEEGRVSYRIVDEALPLYLWMRIARDRLMQDESGVSIRLEAAE